MTRYLLITRRRISASGVSSYFQLWGRVRDAAEEAGANAWNFVSISDPAQYTEFIEWKPSAISSIVAQPPLAAVWKELNAAFPYQDSDTWKSAIS